ncbi:MAG: error-prone DNA polymerase [Firmicutes bacterium HGW-Firmicutes-15]|nr:MAG: error-prone DNA polymerase [Firmicutes bacterium HGW-Firmicutes-15]
MSFVHLHSHTPFSFLDGASCIEDMVNRVAELQMPAMAISDHNNVCAAVKFFKAAEKAGIKPIQGTEISLEGGSHLTLLARNDRGYASICSLLTHAHLDNSRLEPCTKIAELDKLTDVIVLSGCRRGQLSTLIFQGKYREAYEQAKHYRAILGPDNFYIELQNCLLPGDSYLNRHLIDLSQSLGIEAVATNNAHYAEHEDFMVHDILTCARTLSKLEEIHSERPINGESYIKSALQMQELFSICPQAIQNTLRIAGECEPVFKSNVMHPPHFELPPGQQAAAQLRHLTLDGARRRYGSVNQRVIDRLEHELAVIEQMGFADYFLLVWDLARFARGQGIRYAGRGSAADSLAAYCLYITEVDSLERGLLFARFMSPERVGLPDIDIDFESRHRDRVIEYVYSKYGHDKVARVATYNTFRARSALRDIGKALGFSEEELGPIAKRLPHTYADVIRRVLDRLPELRDSPLKGERFKLLLDICEKLAGFPRFLGMHLGGLVISDMPLQNFTPLQRSARGPVICQFDKDDVEDLGLVKLDLLSLRTLTVVQEASCNIISEHPDFDYDAIRMDDVDTYQLIARGETIGVFQLESPAQRALQSRLEADNMEDMVASMALIRPGPIKGNMVEPYIARRQGQEAVTYLHPLLEPILSKTYGVVLFQEQVIEIAQAVGGFSAGEADQLRRVMTHARSQKLMEEIGAKFVSRAVENGITKDLAEQIFSYMLGYASYGFCEAHAAAFAATSFKTAYLSRHYPAEYYTAILNNQPMGYYPPHVICNEARRRGITILPPDINRSGINFALEAGAIRVGLKQVKSISKSSLESIMLAQREMPFSSLQDCINRNAVNRDELENLIKCGAFDKLHANRRQLLVSLPEWLEEKRLDDRQVGKLFKNQITDIVTDFSLAQKKALEYEILGIDTGEHFMASLRLRLQSKNIKSSRDLGGLISGSYVKVAGLLLHPHRPPTRSGKIVVFFSLEDEFGMIDITMFEDVYMRFGKYIFGEQLGPLLVKGQLQRRGNGNSILAVQVSFLDESSGNSGT